jgi:hypothetical protein
MKYFLSHAKKSSSFIRTLNKTFPTSSSFRLRPMREPLSAADPTPHLGHLDAVKR